MCVCGCLILADFAKSTGAGQDYLSPVAVVADKGGRSLYVAEYTAKQVAVFDVASNKVTSVIPLTDSPTDLAISPDQSRLYVSCGSAAGEVCVIDLKTQSAADSIPAGHTPSAVVVSPNGKTLYVCNQFDNNVSVVELASKKEVARIPVAREPVAAAITPNGKLLFVGNLLPAGAADGNYTAAVVSVIVVSVIDTSEKRVVNNIQLPNGSTGLRGICVSPDGRYAYVTHILGRYQMPTTQLERGWMNTNAGTFEYGSFRRH